MIWQAALRKAAGRLDRFGPGTMHFRTIRDSGLENNLWPLCQTAQERPCRELMVDANRCFIRGSAMPHSIVSIIKPVTNAAKEVNELVKSKRRDFRRWKYDRKVSIESATVMCEILNDPRDMTDVEKKRMKEARTCLNVLAQPILNEEDWSVDACGEVDALGLPPGDVGQALKDAMAGLGSDQLRKLRVRAVQLYARAHEVPQRTDKLGPRQYEEPSAKAVDQRRLVFKLIVESCNDRIIAKGYSSPFLGPSAKTKEEKAIDGKIARRFYADTLVSPSKELVQAIKDGRSIDDVQKLIEGLALGYKTFGDGLLFRALFDEFKEEELGSSCQELIDQIGCRAVALLETAKRDSEAYLHGWLMRKVHNTYYCRHGQQVRDHKTGTKWVEPKKGLPQPAPTEADKAWALCHLTGGDKEIQAVMQALLEGQTIKGSIGPLEALSAKLDSPEFRSTWNSLVVAFRHSKPHLDLSRLKEFG